MASLAKRAVLAAALLLGALPSAYSACSIHTNCNTCADGECVTSVGCYDNSPGDYNPRYCSDRPLNITPGDGGGQGLPGFEGEDCGTSLALGVMSAFFCGGLMFLGALRVRKGVYKSSLLSGSASKVTMTQAVLKSKDVQASKGGGDGGGIATSMYFFTVEFLARHTDNSAYNVKAKIRVLESIYNQFEPGASVDVVFPVNNERNFELVRSLTDDDGISGGRKAAHILAGVVSVVGLGLLILSIVQMDCELPLSIFAFIAFGLTMFACTFCVCFPMYKSLSFKNRECEVSPVGQLLDPGTTSTSEEETSDADCRPPCL